MVDAIIAAAFGVFATALYVIFHQAGVPWAGTVAGHMLGILGTLLMLWAGFGYSWSKRHPAASPAAMQSELSIHAAAGIIGPYIVLLHSGFALRGVAGALVLVTILVVVSGIVGRAMLAEVPRPIVGPDPAALAKLDDEMMRVEGDLARLAHASMDERERDERQHALRSEWASLQHRQDRMKQQWVSLDGGRARRAVSAWWLLHVPASMVLWALALGHVVAALYYGTFGK